MHSDDQEAQGGQLAEGGLWGKGKEIEYNPRYDSYLVKLQRQRSQRGAASRNGTVSEKANPQKRSYGDGNPPPLLSGRVEASPLRSSVSQVLQSNSFDRNISQFFGVTPLQHPKPESKHSSAPIPAGKIVPKDQAWSLAQGYGEEAIQPRSSLSKAALLPNIPAGRKISKDPAWNPAEGYSSESFDESLIPEAPQRVRIVEAVKSVEAAIPAGKIVPKEPAWSHNIGYRDTVHKVSSPIKVMQTAGHKIVKDAPWKIAEGYSAAPVDEDSEEYQRKDEWGYGVPAGKKVPKDPVWRLGEGDRVEAYRKSEEFVGYSPELKSRRDAGKSPFQYTAGKKIARDAPLALAHEYSPPKEAVYGAEVPSRPVLSSRLRSLTPQPSSLP